MSLFKVRDLWSTRCGKDETFEQNSLLIADLDGQQSDYIIVGSHSGYLRIFYPQIDIESEDYGQFKPTDMLIEIQLEEPILQIGIGKFVSGSKAKHLALLHPRSVAIYSFIVLNGSAEHGDQCQINIVYQHHLKRSAHSMVVGGFGGVEGRDFLCVQGLDGTLMFYEQETLTLTRPLPNFLLPSPIVYIPHTDSFVVLNANWCLESYRYQLLGEESSSQVMPSWSYNLGEAIVDMQCMPLTTTEAAIFILTDRNFYCFGETGHLKFSKRLQYTPLCCYIYSKGDPTVMSMVISDTNSVLIYEGTRLRWAAQLHFAPVLITRAKFQSLEGCVVLLSEEGELECDYLGTEAMMFVPPPLSTSVTSSTELDHRYATLQHQIATYSQSNKDSVGAASQKTEIKISCKVWPMSEEETFCKVDISVKAVTPVHNVNVNVTVRSPLVARPSTHFIQDLSESAELQTGISLEEGLPWDMECSVVCSYLTSERCGTSSASFTLPLQLPLLLAAPLKGAQHSLILTASQTVILPAIFQDYSADVWNRTGSNELNAGFLYRNNPEMGFTISVNKAAFKYRVESDHIPALTLPLLIMVKKLASKHLKCGQYSIAINDLFEAVDENIRLRNCIRETQTELKMSSGQMRSAQRRLLGKMRDKTPSDLTSLNLLIDYTHNYIMEAAHRMENLQQDLVRNGYILGNFIKLTCTLMKLTGAAADGELDNLYEAISYTDHSSENQGWAEITQASLSHLLKTSLARSVKDQFAPDPQEEIVTKSINLKKQLANAIDRVVKGQIAREDRAVSTIFEGENEDEREGQASLYDGLESEEIKNMLQKSERNLDHL